MIEQVNFDDYGFPTPKKPEKTYYLVEFSQFKVRAGKFTYDLIARRYFEKKHFDLIDSIVECYYLLFREWICIEIIEKKEVFQEG